MFSLEDTMNDRDEVEGDDDLLLWNDQRSTAIFQQRVRETRANSWQSYSYDIQGNIFSNG